MRRKSAFAFKHKDGPNGKEISIILQKLPAGCPVLVYWSSTKRWEGPLKFLIIEREAVVVIFNRRLEVFRSSCVKPMVTPMIEVDVARGNKDFHSKKEKAYCKISKNERILSDADNEPDKINYEEVISRDEKPSETPINSKGLEWKNSAVSSIMKHSTS